MQTTPFPKDSMVDVSAFKKLQEMLDAQDVPAEGRILRYVGKDGNTYEICQDHPIPEEFIEQMPDWLRGS